MYYTEHARRRSPIMLKHSYYALLAITALCVVQTNVATGEASRSNRLQDILSKKLPVLGHRNWVVIADMAYPAQSSPGIETVYVGGDHVSAIREALHAIEKAPHVRPVVYLDKELQFVAEDDAPGISRLRADLTGLMDKKVTHELKHEEIISKLDEAGKSFKLLVIKTDCTLPYTSVFVRLECGYWSDAAEKKLREDLR